MRGAVYSTGCSVWLYGRKYSCKSGETVYPARTVQNAVADVWMIFKNYGDGDGSESYWDRLVEELCRVMKQYQRCPLIINLVIHVTLEAIEDIQQKKQAMSKKIKGEKDEERKCTNL